MRYMVWLFIASVCLVSCSFNRQFYPANKIPPSLAQAKVVFAGGDTTFFNIGRGFQPVVTGSKNDPASPGYSIESIIFQNRAGKNLVGWFIQPRNKIKPETTVLFLHGNGGNILTELPSALQLVKHGMQVYIFDYSGYGFSEGKPKRQRILYDAEDALKVLRKRSVVKNTRMVIYGQSLGGHLAGVVAGRNEDLVDGIVIEGGFSSHKDISAHQLGPFGFIARLLVREGYCAKKAIRNYHKPLLVVHSTEDEIVPYSMGQKIYANANAPKTFYEIRHKHIRGLVYYADSITYRMRAMLGSK